MTRKRRDEPIRDDRPEVRLGDRVLALTTDARPYLVTQIGNLFEREHPEVPVLATAGRYLVVSLTVARVRALQREATRCWALRPLPADHVVFEVRRPPPARRAPPSWVADLVAAVSEAEARRVLEHLASLPTRHSTSRHYVEAARWAEGRLRALGYATRTERVPLNGKRSLNVIAERLGAGAAPRGLVLVTAHLDSINIDGGAAAPAPGADDNASGSAGVFEIARVFGGHRAANDFRLILFGGEEQGLFGSLHHVAALSTAERARIRAVVNMDMVATRTTAAPTVLLEGAALSRDIMNGLAGAADAHTDLVVQTSLNPFNSDHVPFIDAGIPAVLTIEGADQSNANVHTENDTLAHIDYGLLTSILRMIVGFAAERLDRKAVPG